MNARTITPAAIAWIVTSILLLAATLYNVMSEGELGIVGIILFASLVAYFLVYLLMPKTR